MIDTSTNIVGAAHDYIQHDSSIKHVTGKAVYIDDMPNLPRTLELVLVTSPHAHANIRSIDKSVALASNGVAAIISGDDIIGNRTRVKVVKNKVAPPFRKVEFDIMFGLGISRSGEVLDQATDLDIIKKSGSWFSYEDTKLGQGRDAVKQVIADNPELSLEIETKIKESLAQS